MNGWVIQEFVRSPKPPAPRRSWRFILGAALSMILHGLLLLWLIDPVLRSQTPSAISQKPDLAVAWFELVDVPPSKAPPKPKPATAPAAAPRPRPEAALKAPAQTVLATPAAEASETEASDLSTPPNEQSASMTEAVGGQGDSADTAPSAHGQPEPADYVWNVLSHLEHFQSYPERARRRGDSGTVVVRARVSRRGVVLASEILSSSGSRILDQAALALLAAASPLPKPPPGDTSITELELPIVYRLGPP